MNLITKIAPILFANIFFTQNVISQSSFTSQWQYDILNLKFSSRKFVINKS